MGIRITRPARSNSRSFLDGMVLAETRKITLDIHAAVVRGSPVDDGDFRADWSAETPEKAYDPGRITNTKIYGPALARGHSPQAPDGWIDNAVEAVARGKS